MGKGNRPVNIEWLGRDEEGEDHNWDRWSIQFSSVAFRARIRDRDRIVEERTPAMEKSLKNNWVKLGWIVFDYAKKKLT